MTSDSGLHSPGDKCSQSCHRYFNQDVSFTWIRGMQVLYLFVSSFHQILRPRGEEPPTYSLPWTCCLAQKTHTMKVCIMEESRYGTFFWVLSFQALLFRLSLASVPAHCRCLLRAYVPMFPSPPGNGSSFKSSSIVCPAYSEAECNLFVVWLAGLHTACFCDVQHFLSGQVWPGT